MKDVDFAHKCLIKTFRTIVYLKIVNNNKFSTNALFIAKNNKSVFYEFKIIINSNTNAAIKIMLNNVEKNFER